MSVFALRMYFHSYLYFIFLSNINRFVAHVKENPYGWNDLISFTFSAVRFM